MILTLPSAFVRFTDYERLEEFARQLFIRHPNEIEVIQFDFYGTKKVFLRKQFK